MSLNPKNPSVVYLDKDFFQSVQNGDIRYHNTSSLPVVFSAEAEALFGAVLQAKDYISDHRGGNYESRIGDKVHAFFNIIGRAEVDNRLPQSATMNARGHIDFGRHIDFIKREIDSLEFNSEVEFSWKKLNFFDRTHSPLYLAHVTKMFKNLDLVHKLSL